MALISVDFMVVSPFVPVVFGIAYNHILLRISYKVNTVFVKIVKKFYETRVDFYRK